MVMRRLARLDHEPAGTHPSRRGKRRSPNEITPKTSQIICRIGLRPSVVASEPPKEPHHGQTDLRSSPGPDLAPPAVYGDRRGKECAILERYRLLSCVFPRHPAMLLTHDNSDQCSRRIRRRPKPPASPDLPCPLSPLRRRCHRRQGTAAAQRRSIAKQSSASVMAAFSRSPPATAGK